MSKETPMKPLPIFVLACLVTAFYSTLSSKESPHTFKVAHLTTGDTAEAKICPCSGPEPGDTVRLGSDGVHSGLRETEKGEQYVLLEEVD